jgi:hypothetical protein
VPPQTQRSIICYRILAITDCLQNIPDNFHHKPKTLGVAVVTDIDDGKPGAYDLPSTSQAGKAGAVALPKDKDGKPIKPGSGGELQEGEKERWVDRAGWAPRFGQGVMLDADESYLDEQTWVEGKLPDKFYGGKSICIYGRFYADDR